MLVSAYTFRSARPRRDDVSDHRVDVEPREALVPTAETQTIRPGVIRVVEGTRRLVWAEWRKVLQ
jgi:hypothetical protein